MTDDSNLVKLAFHAETENDFVMLWFAAWQGVSFRTLLQTNCAAGVYIVCLRAEIVTSFDIL
jgi:hypothetical protein